MPTYDLWLYMMPHIDAAGVQRTMRQLFDAIGTRVVVRKVDNFGVRHTMNKLRRHQRSHHECHMLRMTLDMNGWLPRRMDHYLKGDDRVLRWKVIRINDPKVRREDTELPKRDMDKVLDHFHKLSPTEFPTREQLESMRSADPHEASIEELEESLQIGMPVRKLQMEMWLQRAEELARERGRPAEYTDALKPAEVAQERHQERMQELEEELEDCKLLTQLHDIRSQFESFRDVTLLRADRDAANSPLVRDWCLSFADSLKKRRAELLEAEHVLLRSEVLTDRRTKNVIESSRREIAALREVYAKEAVESVDAEEKAALDSADSETAPDDSDSTPGQSDVFEDEFLTLMNDSDFLKPL